MDYHEAAARLAPLEAFDSAAFLGADDASQELCDFVLALALTYNDFRDTLMAHTWLSAVEPAEQPTPTPQRGLHGGLRTTLTRIHAGLVHELLALVERSEAIMEEGLFVRLITQLSGPGREAWQAVRDVAAGRHAGTPFARALLLLRHKIAFHYDAEQIGAGYRSAFISPGTHGEPMLCRGISLVETRFLFADAAAQSYVRQKVTDAEARDFLEGRGELIRHIHHALFEVVTRFIQTRGHAWRTVRP